MTRDTMASAVAWLIEYSTRPLSVPFTPTRAVTSSVVKAVLCKRSVPRWVSVPNSESSTSLAASRNGLTNSTFIAAALLRGAFLDQPQVVEKALDLFGRRAQGAGGVGLPHGARACAAAADCTDGMRRRVGEEDHGRQRVRPPLVCAG